MDGRGYGIITCSQFEMNERFAKDFSRVHFVSRIQWKRIEMDETKEVGVAPRVVSTREKGRRGIFVIRPFIRASSREETDADGK